MNISPVTLYVIITTLIAALACNAAPNSRRMTPARFWQIWGRDVAGLAIHDVKLGMHFAAVTNRLPNPQFSSDRKLSTCSKIIERSLITNLYLKTGPRSFSLVDVYKTTQVSVAFDQDGRAVLIKVIFDNLTPDQIRSVTAELKERYTTDTSFEDVYQPGRYRVSQNIKLRSLQTPGSHPAYRKIINTYTHISRYTNACHIADIITADDYPELLQSKPEIEPPVKNLF